MHPFQFGQRFRPSLSFVLLCCLFATLWIAGGASRIDAAGQVVVRSVSATLLIVAIMFGTRPNLQPVRPVVLLMVAAVLLPLLQLIPLPPAIWHVLPGRKMLEEAGAASGQPALWRPWSIVPGATVNAAMSLLIPVTTLSLAATLERAEHLRLAGLILVVTIATTLVGLLQFSGTAFANPLVNDAVGEVSGTFANRNHFAVFMAVGCLVAPVWAFEGRRMAPWRPVAALGLVILFGLSILASGSRTGMALGLLGIVIALVLVRQDVARTLRRFPKWVTYAVLTGVIATITTMVLISIAADRAISIDRLYAMDPGQDMRGRALPTVVGMIREYLPWGSGLGGFDPIFRMHEPFALLEPTYFNHAHNDLIEVVLDAGVPGLLLLLGFLGWWAWASWHAWRTRGDMGQVMPRLGSAMLLLVTIASAFDYPARTPMVMAVAIVAGLWLSGAAEERAASALPRPTQHL